MNEWLNSLKPTERRMVLGGGGVAILLLLYALVWSPFSRGVERLERRVAEQQALKIWMTHAANQVQQLRGAGVAPVNDGRSLLSLVDHAARVANLAPAIRRIEPEGQHTVRVTLEQAAFSDVAQWLGTLAQQHGVQVESMSFDKGAAPGAVNARLALKRGAA